MAKERSEADLAAAASQAGGEVAKLSTPKPTPTPAPSRPPVPLTAQSIDPKAEVVHRNMHGAILTVDEPAQGGFSAVLTKRWGELAMESDLGTPRPPLARVGLDESKRFLFMAPAKADDPLGLEMRYGRGSAYINLVKAFAPLKRFVAPGRREFYEVGITDHKVRFEDGFEAISFYVYLVPDKEEPRRTMSEEAKAKLRATLARKKQQKAGQDQAPAGE